MVWQGKDYQVRKHTATRNLLKQDKGDMASMAKYHNLIIGFKAQLMQLEAFPIEEVQQDSSTNKASKGSLLLEELVNSVLLVSLRGVFPGYINNRLDNIRARPRNQVLSISNKAI